MEFLVYVLCGAFPVIVALNVVEESNLQKLGAFGLGLLTAYVSMLFSVVLMTMMSV